MGRGEGEWCGGHAHAVHLDDVLRLKVRQVLEVLHLRDMSRGHVSDDVSPAHVAGPLGGRRLVPQPRGRERRDVRRVVGRDGGASRLEVPLRAYRTCRGRVLDAPHGRLEVALARRRGTLARARCLPTSRAAPTRAGPPARAPGGEAGNRRRRPLGAERAYSADRGWSRLISISATLGASHSRMSPGTTVTASQPASVAHRPRSVTTAFGFFSTAKARTRRPDAADARSVAATRGPLPAPTTWGSGSGSGSEVGVGVGVGVRGRA